MLGWTNGDLAQKAGLSRNTVQALLASDDLTGTIRTLHNIVHALTDAGIVFVQDDNTDAVGVMLRRPAARAARDKDASAGHHIMAAR